MEKRSKKDKVRRTGEKAKLTRNLDMKNEGMVKKGSSDFLKF